MRIPIFLSCPTKLSPARNRSRKLILGLLDEFQLEPRAPGGFLTFVLTPARRT